MAHFSYMKVLCPICGSEMDGMQPYGRQAHCCGRECYQEWEWRQTLAIMGKPYEPDPRRTLAREAAREET
jgi:hypothetical protein